MNMTKASKTPLFLDFWCGCPINFTLDKKNNLVNSKKNCTFVKNPEMNIYEKTGDFLLDLSKLVIGAVILGGIMTEGFDTFGLYLYGGIFTSGVLAAAYIFFNIKPKMKG
jgi:hypothetical protein